MSSGIIETIKKVAINAFEASSPVKLLFGKVVSVDPIKIQVGEFLTLTKEFLVINGTVEKDDDVSLIRCQGGQKYVVLGSRTVYVENTVYVGGGIVGDTVIDRAVSWAVSIANDNSHGYDQSKRWGPDYDCSAFVITAYENAGVPVRSKGGAQSTHNMYRAFINNGFKDVTSSVNRSNGSGTKKGDVLLQPGSHTAMVIADGGSLVHASINERGTITGGASGDQTGKEITTRSYYNHPWTYVLRYTG